MRTIAEAVREIVGESEPVTTSLRQGYLNMSAYAQSILPIVENKTRKQVQLSSIVVALMRMRSDLQKSDPLLPIVAIDDLSLKTGLVEIVFERTDDNLKTLHRLHATKSVFSDCLMVSHGVGEIAVIAFQKAENALCTLFDSKPRAVIRNLASLTIRYSPKYIELPNSLYAIFQRFAAKRLNIVEVISTYTEVTLIVAERDIDTAFRVLSSMQRGC